VENTNGEENKTEGWLVQAHIEKKNKHNTGSVGTQIDENE
jgi:hypothetical protein